MAVKKKRRRVKKRRAKSNPKKTRRKKKRKAVSNPTKRRKSSRRRRKASNPRRRRGRRVRRASARNPGRRKRSRGRRRRAVANPSRRRRSGKRRSRRNPDLPAWAATGLAAIAGLLSYGVLGAGTFALTQRLDPSLATLQRNRYIAGALGVAGGIVLGFAHPLAGVAVAAGSLASLAGSQLSMGIGKVIEKKAEAPKAIAGVFMPQAMAGVAQAPRLGMGALAQMGDWAAAGYGPAYARR